MISFRTVFVGKSEKVGETGWAVERTEPDGLRLVVSRLYRLKADAERETSRLNQEAARRTMR